MSLMEKVYELYGTMNSMFSEKDIDIISVLAGLFSGEPVLLIGDVGTAKTKMIEVLASLIDAKYFYYLLTRFTEPDELLGSIDVVALREGIYRRNMKNRLPDSNIVFLDEVFKASSSIRNVLLDIMLNKRIYDAGSYIDIPMVALYTASNEISEDEEDRAFLDRLVIKVFVKNVTDIKDLLVKGVMLEYNGSSKKIMSVQDVMNIQAIVKKRMKHYVEDEAMLNRISSAFFSLGNKLFISDRTKVKTLKVASALSIIYGEEKPSLDAFAEALKLTVPRSQDDLKVVVSVILSEKLSSVTTNIQKLMTLRDELSYSIRQFKSVKKVTPDDVETLKGVVNKVVAEIEKIGGNPVYLPYLREIKRLVIEVGELLERAHVEEKEDKE